MALIKCPDCQETVSSQAYACPKCGRQIKYWTPGRILLAIIVLPLSFIIASQVPACFPGFFTPDREPLKYEPSMASNTVPATNKTNTNNVAPSKSATATPMFQAGPKR